MAVVWKAPTNGAVASSPAIGSDGTVYFVGADSGSVPNLYAVNPANGSVAWNYKFGSAQGSTDCTPTIGPDTNIYVGCNGSLYGISATTHQPIWSATAAGGGSLAFPAGTATAISSGTIYLGIGPNFFAVDSTNGNEIWEFDNSNGGESLTYPVNSSPAVSNGTVYFGDGDKLWAVSTASGKLKWMYEVSFTAIGDPASGSNPTPAIGSDGTIYIGGDGNALYAVTDNGSAATKKWVASLSGPVTAGPTIGSDGTIYLASNTKTGTLCDLGECLMGTGFIVALDPTSGNIKWTYPTSPASSTMGDIMSAPAIGSDGTIYFDTSDGNFYALTDNGTSATLKGQASIGQGQNSSSPAIGKNGVVYIGSNNNNLYAIQGSGSGLANSAWPMFGQSGAHAGTH